MMPRSITAILTLALLPACATDWHAQRGTVPTTYELPSSRANRSVGNLRRLAVLPLRVDRVTVFAVWTKASRQEAGEAYDGLCGYLTETKGYEVVRVVDPDGSWRAEAVATPEFGTIEQLVQSWTGAEGDAARAAAMHRLGQVLRVDGILAAWTQEYATDVGFLEGTGLGVANILLLNLPLLYFLQHAYAEAVVYETASGEPVWRRRLSGPSEGKSARGVWPTLLEDLENAIPVQFLE